MNESVKKCWNCKGFVPMSRFDKMTDSNCRKCKEYLRKEMSKLGKRGGKQWRRLEAEKVKRAIEQCAKMRVEP